jgi:diguanylate cyclase (GGDEF)-like protein
MALSGAISARHAVPCGDSPGNARSSVVLRSRRSVIQMPASLRHLGVPGWNDADKILLSSGLALPFGIGWLLRSLQLAADAAQSTYVDRTFLPVMLPFLWAQVGCHLLLILVALALRGRPRLPWLVHAEIQLWTATLAWSLYVLGPFTTSMGVLLLAVPVIGYLIFEPRPMNIGLISLAIGLGLAVGLPIVGAAPYAPFLARAPYAAGRLETPWLISFGLPSLFAAVLCVVVHTRLLRRLRERQADLERLSSTDGLTGLVNRRVFFQRMAEEMARARRYALPLCLVMIDLDHFKAINDGYGHLIGDRVLRDLGGRMREAVRVGDVAARYGGEEFAVLLPHTALADACVVAARLLAVPRAVLVGDGPGARGATASLGVAELRADEDSDALIARADAALFAAKRGGRDRVEVAA